MDKVSCVYVRFYWSLQVEEDGVGKLLKIWMDGLWNTCRYRFKHLKGIDNLEDKDINMDNMKKRFSKMGYDSSSTIG